MASDTRNERFALISLGQWRGRVLPWPDGVIDAFDRVHLALRYPLGAPTPNTFEPHYAAQTNKTVGIVLTPE